MNILELPDAAFIRRMREGEVPSFIKLADMLASDFKASVAMKSEIEFVQKNPDTPRGEEFAWKVRVWMIENNLEWNQINLQKAVDAIRSSHDQRSHQGVQP